MAVCNDCIPCYHCKETNNCNEIQSQIDLNMSNADLLGSMAVLEPFMVTDVLLNLNCTDRNLANLICSMQARIDELEARLDKLE